MPATMILVTLALFMCCCSTQLTAQQTDYYVRHFNNENGLVQNSIKGMEIDRTGYLWLATEMGIARYNGKTFKLYNQKNSPELNADRMLSMGLLKDSSMFVKASDYHYYAINNAGKLQNLPGGELYKQLKQDEAPVTGYTLYDSCQQWYKAGRIAAWAIPDISLISRSIQNSVVYFNRHYFYFNPNRDLISVDSSLKNFSKITVKGILFNHIRKVNRHATAISILQRGPALYLRWNNYIYRLEFSNGFQEVSGKQVLQVGEVSNITSFLEWPQHNLSFVGTMADGLYIFQKKMFSVLTLNDKEANVFYAQAAYGRDGVLTKKGVLFPDRQIPVAGFASESILKTTAGHYYLSYWDAKDSAGIVEMDDHLKKIKNIKEYNLHVNCFQQLSDGSVWLSTDDRLLGKIDSNNITWIPRPKILPENFYVKTFIEAGPGQLWIAGGGGLGKMNMITRQVSLVSELQNTTVRALYKDDSGILWIGTYGRGFYALYHDRLISFPLDKNNYLLSVHCFIKDNRGCMWLTTNRGLLQLSVKDMYDFLEAKIESIYYYYYSTSDGFLTNEFNGGCTPAFAKLSNGKFSLPSIKGLVQFHPDSIKNIFPSSPIFIDEVTLDGNDLPDFTMPIKISSKISRLQFYVSSPYFGNQYNQQIEYNVEGLDSTWYNLNENGIISLNKLNGGSYNLIVRKKSGFGPNSNITKKLPFVVAPYFTETWLFKGVLSLFMAVLIYLSLRFRIHLLLRLKNKLQKELFATNKEQAILIESLERTVAELEESKEELYQNNIFRRRLAFTLAHDLKSPLRFLNGAIYSLNENLAQHKNEDVVEIGTDLQKSSASILNFVNDFGYWLNALDKDFRVEKEHVNISDILVELELFFSELLNTRKNKIVMLVNRSVAVNTNRQLLTIILRNLVDNANKNTTGGIIEISLLSVEDKATIILRDNGNGMSASALNDIIQKTRQGISYQNHEESLHGYQFIADFAKLLDISIKVESVLAKGTTVYLGNFEIV